MHGQLNVKEVNLKINKHDFYRFGCEDSNFCFSQKPVKQKHCLSKYFYGATAVQWAKAFPLLRLHHHSR